MLTDSRSGALGMTFQYDPEGRLASAVQPATGNGGAYAYDAFGLLSSRTVNQSGSPSTTTLYVYDLKGHVIAETDTTGATRREYIWMDDLPVAVVSGVNSANPTLYYVHADHLGRPARMTDQDQSWVWDVIYSPFGATSYIWSNPATMDLRFPGQWFQLETGLAYNWHRHYDPTIGRYLQPDPLGYGGGRNLYAYVGGNPISLLDPWGLAVIRSVPSDAVTYTAPDGQCFYAPPNVNWNDIQNAGARDGLTGANANMGQNGTYDLQRSGGDVYTAYANAANYAVGVYVYGAGYSQTSMYIIGQAYGFFKSSNFGNNNWPQWWNNGWNAANTGLPSRPSNCKCPN